MPKRSEEYSGMMVFHGFSMGFPMFSPPFPGCFPKGKTLEVQAPAAPFFGWKCQQSPNHHRDSTSKW